MAIKTGDNVAQANFTSSTFNLTNIHSSLAGGTLFGVMNGPMVTIIFEKYWSGAKQSGWIRVATIPAGFRPAYWTQGSLSRNYESGMDCVVTPGGAFGLRTLPISKTTCSGQIVYFR